MAKRVKPLTAADMSKLECEAQALKDVLSARMNGASFDAETWRLIEYAAGEMCQHARYFAACLTVTGGNRP
jgi:hypothetical protein